MKLQNKIKIIGGMGAGCVLLFIVGVFTMNRSVDRQMGAQMQAPASEVALRAEAPAPQPALADGPRQLEASDLSHYRIIPQKLNRFTNNQRYWDSMTENALGQTDTIGRMEKGGIFKGATMTPVEFQKQLQRINGRIEEYEQIVIREPGNGHAQKKLNDLYMLKSTISALKPAIVGK